MTFAKVKPLGNFGKNLGYFLYQHLPTLFATYFDYGHSNGVVLNFLIKYENTTVFPEILILKLDLNFKKHQVPSRLVVRTR